MGKIGELINGRENGAFTIGNCTFNFKRNYSYVESIIGKIADMFGIQHVQYAPVRDHGLDYYIYDDMSYLEPVVKAEDTCIQSSNINEIRDAIYYLYPEDADAIMTQFMKMFFMDLMVLNNCRRNDSWGFRKNGEHSELCLIDNDSSFLIASSFMSSCDNPENDSQLEIENILDNFPVEYIELFKSMFQALDYDMLKQIMEDTEKELDSRLDNKYLFLGRFDIFRDKILEIMNRKNVQLEKKES